LERRRQVSVGSDPKRSRINPGRGYPRTALVGELPVRLPYRSAKFFRQMPLSPGESRYFADACKYCIEI
jgi:hypothetical protein